MSLSFLFILDRVLAATYPRAMNIDCRINAFPVYTEYKGINRQAPDFIFIDIDKNHFEGDSELQKALAGTLLTIRTELGGHPTVVWSGNGFHVYHPLGNRVVLEHVTEFAQSEEPSIKFLRFSAHKLPVA